MKARKVREARSPIKKVEDYAGVEHRSGRHGLESIHLSRESMEEAEMNKLT
jgi:hypothetical protein